MINFDKKMFTIDRPIEPAITEGQNDKETNKSLEIDPQIIGAEVINFTLPRAPPPPTRKTNDTEKVKNS